MRKIKKAEIVEKNKNDMADLPPVNIYDIIHPMLHEFVPLRAKKTAGRKYCSAVFNFLESNEGRHFLTSLYRDEKLTDSIVVQKLGVSVRQFYDWRNESKIIKQAISVGKSSVDTMVENAMLQSALNGNVTAMIFWLKNRKPQKWRDVNQKEDTLETALSDKINITVNYK